MGNEWFTTKAVHRNENKLDTLSLTNFFNNLCN